MRLWPAIILALSLLAFTTPTFAQTTPDPALVKKVDVSNICETHAFPFFRSTCVKPLFELAYTMIVVASLTLVFVGL